MSRLECSQVAVEEEVGLVSTRQILEISPREGNRECYSAAFTQLDWLYVYQRDFVYKPLLNYTYDPLRFSR